MCKFHGCMHTSHLLTHVRGGQTACQNISYVQISLTSGLSLPVVSMRHSHVRVRDDLERAGCARG